MIGGVRARIRRRAVGTDGADRTEKFDRTNTADRTDESDRTDEVDAPDQAEQTDGTDEGALPRHREAPDRTGPHWQPLLAPLAVPPAFLVMLQAAEGRPTWVAAPFALLVPGLVTAAWLRASLLTVAGIGPVAGLSLLVAQATLSLWLGIWDPLAGTALLAAGFLAAALVRIGLDLAELADLARSLPALFRRMTRVPRGGTVALVASTAVTTGLWAVSLPGVATSTPHPWGLLATAPPAWLAAALVPPVLLVVAVRAGSLRAAVVAIALAVLVYRVTGSAVSEAPMYAWTYKHLGVVDAISRYQVLIPGLDIYHDWPGMFAAAAWLSTTTGISPLAMALAITPMVHVLLATGVAVLARRLGAEPLTAATAAFLTVALDWVGQDYFAPQALAMVLVPAVLSLALAGRTDPAAGWCALPVFCCMVCTHQLTPFWVLAVVWLLVPMRATRIWLAAAMTVVLGAYLVVHFDAVAGYGLFSGLDVVANARTNTGSEPTPQQQLVSLTSRGASLLLWGGAAAGTVWAIVTRRPRWLPTAAIAASPVALLFAQNYGGEAVIRVYLYSLAGCTILIAPLLNRLLRGAATAAVAGVLAAAVLIAVGTQAYFGTWFVYQVSAAEARVAAQLLDEAPTEVLLTSALPNWPTRSTAGYVDRLEWFVDFDRTAYHGVLRGRDFTTESDFLALEAVLSDRTWAPVYLLFADSMSRYDDLRGLLAPGAVDRMRDGLATRPGWDVVLRDGDVTVLRHAPGSAQWAPGAWWQPGQPGMTDGS